MKRPGPNQRGYSLIELLVVLAIAGILGVVGVTYLGNRPSSGVRALLDELEGTLYEAQQQAVATGTDITIASSGTWDPNNPVAIVRGVSTIPGADWAVALAAAQTNAWPPAQGGMSVPQYTTLGVGFRLATAGPVGGSRLTREHMNAGVAVNPAWWAAVQGTSGPITAVAPFSTEAGFVGALNNANLFFTGAQNLTVSISGSNKRFNQTFWIPVVAISNGNAVPGGPMGVIFVQAFGGTIYKFYNPGTKYGDGQWRRI